MPITMTRRTTCVVCGAALPKHRRTYCTSTCYLLVHRSDTATRYRKDPAFRHRQLARMTAYRRHKTPQPCEVCGTPEGVHRHHPDHDKPTEIRWLCVPHHFALHRKDRAA